MTTIMDERTDIGTVLTEQSETAKSEQAHIVKVPRDQSDESPQAYVMRARVEGFPVTALCGYTWVPNKMASRLPVCPECKEIFDFDPFASDPGRDLPDE